MGWVDENGVVLHSWRKTKRGTRGGGQRRRADAESADKAAAPSGASPADSAADGANASATLDGVSGDGARASSSLGGAPFAADGNSIDAASTRPIVSDTLSRASSEGGTSGPADLMTPRLGRQLSAAQVEAALRSSGGGGTPASSAAARSEPTEEWQRLQSEHEQARHEPELGNVYKVAILDARVLCLPRWCGTATLVAPGALRCEATCALRTELGARARQRAHRRLVRCRCRARWTRCRVSSTTCKRRTTRWHKKRSKPTPSPHRSGPPPKALMFMTRAASSLTRRRTAAAAAARTLTVLGQSALCVTRLARGAAAVLGTLMTALCCRPSTRRDRRAAARARLRRRGVAVLRSAMSPPAAPAAHRCRPAKPPFEWGQDHAMHGQRT